jgi:Amt family ammonium transporter
VDKKGIDLLHEAKEKMIIFSDRRLMKQVLINLVGNAVKFTDEGSVKIIYRVLKNKNLEVRVIDTVIGIKKEDISKLFGFFQQIDMSSTKKHEGTGLGLYLSKKIVTILGGSISVSSEFGKGSNFTFTLPIKDKESK